MTLPISKESADLSDIDNLLYAFERACERVIVDDDLHAASKERAILRNTLRARLIAGANLAERVRGILAAPPEGHANG